MKTQDIRNMALALQAVEEASKKKMDPVGREDGDIDNDGDKDKTDSYLHNRRKAISSAIKGKGTKETVTTEDVEELDELSKKTLGSYVKKASYDSASKAYKAGDVRDKDSSKNYLKTLGRLSGISTATNKLTKEETGWPVFARIQEKVNQTKGATKPESMEDRFTASDKKMVDGHGGIGKKTPEDYVDDYEIDQNPNQFNAANVKVAPKRHNDQTVGDKTMPKAK